MKKKHAISLMQVLAALLMLPLFFTFVPWTDSHPISRINNYPEMKEGYPPPEWAQYFTVGHGKPTYFKSSPRQQPLRAILHGGGLAVCLALLIIPALYYSPNDKTCGNYFSRKRIHQSPGSESPKAASQE
jgi:hypothetical protein